MAISPAMQAHLNGTTTLAVFLKITAKDGTILRVCNTTRNKILDGETYFAYPIQPTTIQTTNNLKPDNLEVTAIYSQLFTRATLRAKKWLGARIEYRVMNYTDFSMGPATRRVGFIGETTVGRFAAKPELKSLSQKLQEQIGRTFNELCDAELGDDRCRVNLGGLTVTGFRIRSNAHVTAVMNRQQITVAFNDALKPDDPTYVNDPNYQLAADNLYRFGKFTFLSGANNGVVGQIIGSIGNTLTLTLPLFYPAAAGDQIQLVVGCDKRIGTCRDKFANAVNNRSFYCLPGREKLLNIPE